MAENKTLDIIKKAIVLEHRGKALYESVLPKTASEGVKELFTLLAEEEEKHIDVLNKRYKSVAKGGKFDTRVLVKPGELEDNNILSGKIVKEISGAGYEAAIISAALEFEKKAVEYYSEQAKSSDSEEEKQLFQWLAEWEKGHMAMLAQIDKDLMEDIWYDNQFWPLD